MLRARVLGSVSGKIKFGRFNCPTAEYYLTRGVTSLPNINIANSDFKIIRSKKCLYVDKTRHIFDNIVGPTNADNYFFLARNRRTGKSLLCSTIAEMFKGDKDLFKDLWIAKDDVWNFEGEKRPVIHLDMSGVVGKTDEDVVTNVRYVLMNMAKKSNITDLDSTLPVATMLMSLVDELRKKSGKEVVVLIDEYDAPLTHLLHDTEELKKVQITLSEFYGVLKVLGPDLRLVYITGIMKYTNMSLFSKLNNLNDLTFALNAGCMVGYEEKEIRDTFPLHLQALQSELGLSSIDEVIKLLKEKYDGYRYGVKLTECILSNHVFNAFGVNNALAELYVKSNAWFKSGHSGFLVQQIEKESAYLTATNDTIMLFDDLDNACSTADMSSKMLMYYAGYATLKACSKGSDGEGDNVTIGSPNNDVKLLLHSDLFFKRFGVRPSHKLAQKVAKSLLACDENSLKLSLNQLLAHIPYHHFKGKIGEATFHVAISQAIDMGCVGNADVRNEDSTNIGRIDTVVKDDATKSVFIIEYKYDRTAEEALDQIQDKKYADKFTHSGYTIYAVGISIDRKAIADVKMKLIR